MFFFGHLAFLQFMYCIEEMVNRNKMKLSKYIGNLSSNMTMSMSSTNEAKVMLNQISFYF